MATLTTQTITRAGITPAYTAASASDAFETGDICFLHVKNTNGATRDMVFAIPSGKSTYANVTYTSVTVTVPATTGDKMIGPLGDLFRDPTTSLGLVTPSATSGVTYGIFKLQGP